MFCPTGRNNEYHIQYQDFVLKFLIDCIIVDE